MEEKENEAARRRTRGRALRRIELNRIAGLDTRHNRETNLIAIRQLTEGHPHYTFGLHGLPVLSEEEVLEAIADITKCSKDLKVSTGGGYISPRSTLQGLEEAADKLYPLAKKGGRFLLGTGHPGSLLLYYIELGKLIESFGGHLVLAERGAFVPPNFDLDYVEGVAVLSDRCSLFHSHDPKPMEIILASGEEVDMVVSDHGFAAGAVNAGIPVIGIIDTNDPALAVAKRMKADITVIPMDDNRPMYNYLPVVQVIKDFMTLQRGNSVERDARGRVSLSAKGTTDDGNVPQQETRTKLEKAWTLVNDRLESVTSFDEAVEGILDPYMSQFFETHFDPVVEKELIGDPFSALAIYRLFQNALVHYIRDQIKYRRLKLTEEEIDYYLREWRPSDHRKAVAKGQDER